MHIPFSFRRGVALLLAGAALHSIGAARAHAQVPTALPDLNNDGVADYFMRLPVWSTTTDVVGQLRVFSGADNTLLKAFTSLQVDDGFALSTSSAGDLNGDGVDDVLVGAPLAVGDGVVRGKVYVVSGADGVIIDVLVTPPWSYGGMTVAGMGDVDGGGLRDIAYSMRTATDAYEDTGLVVVHSTDTGEPALTLGGTLGDTSFGYAIAYLGDTNGDGSDEIAVSAPVDGGGPGSYGRVFVFECRRPDGSLRDAQTVADARLVIDNTSLPLAVFGGAMYLGPDLDGNGERELVVGSTVFTGAAEVAVIQAYDLTTGAIVAVLSIDSQKLSADINGDLIVDHRDVAEALDRMNQPADPLDPKSGDLDGDGLVDAGDVASVIDNLDQTFITPGTFSNGERAEVTELVTSLLFSQFFPCLGIGIGPGGGLVGITLPPEGPGGGGVIPEFPVNPDTVACCIARMFWLLYPPEDRPPLPSVCDDDDGPDGPGGPGDGGSPRPKPPGWTGEPGGGDDPPECDGMSVIGPTFVEVGGSASFTVNGAPAGFLMWDVYPYPTPYLLRPLVVSTRPVYSVEGVAPGSAMVIARIYENGAVVCGESWPVQVVDCEEMTLNGPGAVSVGAEATYTVQNLGGGVTVEWTITGDLTVVSTTGNSATVRGDSAGSGRVRARGMYQNEPLGCDLAIDVAVVCDFAVNGPATLQDGQVGTYTAHEQYAGQHVVWSASGPLAILGPTTGWGVQAQGTGCGAGVLTARLFDANGPTGCVVNYSVSVAGNAPTPLTLSGLPENGVIQLAPYESERVITLTAEGEGAFAWDIVTSVDGAVIVEPDGATCVLRILEPTHIAASVTRTYCGEQQTVQGEFTALVFDLAIDSDNDGQIAPADDFIEADAPGLVLLANTLDADADGIPDYADGIGLIPDYDAAELLTDGEFAPVVMRLSDVSNVTFNAIDLTYDESDPAGIYVSDTSFFERPNGALRLWLVPATAPRDPRPVTEGGDYVPSGVYLFETLGLTATGGNLTLYLEAIRPSLESGGKTIQAELLAVGPGLEDGPADGPSDLVAITTTEIEILARGRSDTDFFRHNVLVPTELPPNDWPGPPLSNGLQWGAWQAHVIRVHDPRPGFTEIAVANETLPLFAIDDSKYVTPAFLCLDNEELPNGSFTGPVPSAFPDGYTAVWITPGDDVTVAYNPDGAIIRSRGILDVGDETARLIFLVNDDIIPFMESNNWTPHPDDGTPHDGSFGQEVHRRVTNRLNVPGSAFCADVLINTQTMEIVAIGSGHSGNGILTQIDVLALEDGYTIQQGDTLDTNKVKFAFEVKTGINGTVSQQQRFRYVSIFGSNKFRSISSKRRWTLSAGWNDTPGVRKLAKSYNQLSACATAGLRPSLNLAATSIPMIALVDLGEATRKAEELNEILEELQFVHPNDFLYPVLVQEATFKMGQIGQALGADAAPAFIFSQSAFHLIYGQEP